MKIMGINFASQYITMMIQSTDKWAKQLPTDKEIDFSYEISLLTFDIISKILFGRDIDQAEKIQYLNPYTQEVKALTLAEYFIKYVKDELDGILDPKGHIFSFLVTFRL